MPDPITFTEQDTPALSEENIQALEAEQSQQEGEPASLLAGKYKSVEDLERGYKELQAKLSQGKAPESTDDGEQAVEPEQEEQPKQSARELYGEAIGSKLEEAGIDFSDMNTRWQQTGQLTDDDYGALNDAGFTRDMVDSYLSGLQYRANQDTALAVEQITQIKAEYGGEKGYGEMIQWAAENLSAEEIQGFDEIVNGSKSMQAVKLAVAGLYSRYTGATGREPKLIGGRTPREGGDRFESTAQVVEAMKDPRYSSDPAYRKKVEAKLARSSIM